MNLKGKIVKLKEHSNRIQVTPEEAFEMVMENFKEGDSLLLIHMPKKDSWGYVQSGGLMESEVVWALGKIVLQLLGS